MIAYNLSGIKVLNKFLLENDKGKTLIMNVSISGGFATLFLNSYQFDLPTKKFCKIDCPAFALIEVGDWLEIPKAIIKSVKTKGKDGKEYAQLSINTYYVERTWSSNGYVKSSNRPSQKEANDELEAEWDKLISGFGGSNDQEPKQDKPDWEVEIKEQEQKDQEQDIIDWENDLK